MRVPTRWHHILTTLALTLISGAVCAHAALVRSVPGTRAVLQGSPTQIELWFNEAVEESFSTITLVAPGEVEVQLGKPHVDSGDPYRLAADLPVLSPGRYTVRYRVLSKDGHLVEYGYQFVLESAPERP